MAPLSLDQITDRAELGEIVRAALASLTEREQRILTLRFGLGEDRRSQTFGETARATHVTRERVRQIEAKALRKLRQSEYFAPLSG